RAVKALVNLITQRSTREGCAPIATHIFTPCNGDLLPPFEGPVARRALESLSRSVPALDSGNVESAGDELIGLLGLGPGLTPSGDDLLAGLLAGLVWRARLGTFN